MNNTYTGTKILIAHNKEDTKQTYRSRLITMNHEVKTEDQLWEYLKEGCPGENLDRSTFIIKNY